MLNLRRSTIEIQQHNRSQRPQGSTLHILDFGNGDTVSNVTLIEQGAWRGSQILAGIGIRVYSGLDCMKTIAHTVLSESAHATKLIRSVH